MVHLWFGWSYYFNITPQRLPQVVAHESFGVLVLVQVCFVGCPKLMQIAAGTLEIHHIHGVKWTWVLLRFSNHFDESVLPLPSFKRLLWLRPQNWGMVWHSDQELYLGLQNRINSAVCLYFFFRMRDSILQAFKVMILASGLDLRLCQLQKIYHSVFCWWCPKNLLLRTLPR